MTSRALCRLTAPMVGTGLLVAAGATVSLGAAAATWVPTPILGAAWVGGAAGAGKVTGRLDASWSTRLIVPAIPVGGLLWATDAGVLFGLETVTTLAVGLVVFALVSNPTGRRVVATRAGGSCRRALTGMSLAGALVLTSTVPSGAWFAAVRGTPTRAQRNTGGIDLQASTHQWLTARGVEILSADGYDAIAAFLDTPDPTAPGATDPSTGALLGTPNTYRWRLLRGSSDADGILYSQLRDHLLNPWSHRGRQYVVGDSAAANTEKAFDEAVRLWTAADRGNAIYWLGAALHLVQDSCVPQHGWFGLGVYHHDYETWVRDNQEALAVSDAGIYQADFRVGGGHGGEDWSSGHPRGWADECAHRAFRNLPAASHPYPANPGPGDAQWATAPHLADVQRLSAGFIVFFADTVGAP